MGLHPEQLGHAYDEATHACRHCGKGWADIVFDLAVCKAKPTMAANLRAKAILDGTNVGCWTRDMVETAITDTILAAVAEERERCRLLGCKAVDDYEADLAQKDRDREAAVAAEREACAKLAESKSDSLGVIARLTLDETKSAESVRCWELAAAIRDRGKEMSGAVAG